MVSRRPNPRPVDEDAAFLATYDPRAYAQVSVAVDVVLLSPGTVGLRTLLVKRKEPPQRGHWALPGGFLKPEESLVQAAARILQEKAQLEVPYLEQLYTFDAPHRDPRTRVLSVTHLGLLEAGQFDARVGTDPTLCQAAVAVPWEGEAGGPVIALGSGGDPLPLAFDHAEILGLAIKRLRGKLDYTDVAFALLPARFTLFQLQKVHEAVLGRPLNKDSFRRRMLASGQLHPTGSLQEAVGHRPAEHYEARLRD